MLVLKYHYHIFLCIYYVYSIGKYTKYTFFNIKILVFKILIYFEHFPVSLKFLANV